MAGAQSADLSPEIIEAVKAGVIQNFEVAYEQSWKMMRRWLEGNPLVGDVSGASMRQVYRLAAKAGMIDLSPAHLEIVRAVLLRSVPGVPVYAVGSRATRRARKFSDLALVPEQALDWRILARLREAFVESDLSITVDVIDWTQAGPEFKKQAGQLTERVAGA